MNDEILQNIWGLLSSEGATTSDFETWKGNFSTDPVVQENVHKYLKDGGHTDSDIVTWSSNVGLTRADLGAVKKKDQAEQEGMDGSLEDGSSDLSDIPEFDPSTFNYDPTAAGIPQNTQDEGYRNPRTTIGMYPEQEQIDRAFNQQTADYEFTQEQIEADAPDLELRKQQEQQAKQVEAELKQAQILEIQSDPNFVADVSQVDNVLIGKEEEEVVPFLIEKFKKYGFRFLESGIGDNVTVIAPDGKTTETIDLDPFTDSGESEGADKLRKFIKTNLSSAPSKAIDSDVQKAIKAKTLREVGMKNEDGTESTVLMTSFEEDGKHKVIPTLFPGDPNMYTSDRMFWMEGLSFEEALEVARERDEVFEFDTKEEAEAFAEGSWKNVSTAEAEVEQFYNERGLDYKTERKLLFDYEDAKDTENFLETAPFRQSDLNAEDQKKYNDF